MLPSRDIDEALLRGWPLPQPAAGDKNARGSVFVVAGAPQMPGAAILAATSTLRAGAGKLQIGTCRSVAAHVAAAVPESLVVSFDETPAGAISAGCAGEIAQRANRADALVIGPGLVDENAAAALVKAVAQALTTTVVVDAAALACLGESPDAFRRLGGRVVLTPHGGEMASMLGRDRAAVEGDPAACAVEAAHRYHAVVVLKGAVTHIADADGTIYRNADGDIGLATSGSGDTLAGIIGGLAARGATPVQAAVWGVALHARAGARLGALVGMGFLARELPAEIPALMRELRG